MFSIPSPTGTSVFCLLSRWAGVAAATVVASVAAAAVGVPSAALFAALAVGIAYALLFGGAHPLKPPAPVLTFGQVVIGVALGAQLTSDTLSAVVGDWLPIALVTVATLLISVVAGLLLARATGLDRPTALLGLIAGGASGIVAMSDELGADARLVAFMQYLRVLIVVVTAPLVATVLFGAGGDLAAPELGSAGLAADLAFTAGCGIAGMLIARRVPITAGSLLVPLVIAAALSVSGLTEGAHVPDRIQDLGFAAIGLQVGLRFTVATIRQAGHLLPAVLLSLAGMIAGLRRARLPRARRDRRELLRRLPRDDARRPLRRARRGDRRGRERRVRARGPGAAPVRDDPGRAAARAADHALARARLLRYNRIHERGPATLPDLRPARQRGARRARSTTGSAATRRARSTARPSRARATRTWTPPRNPGSVARCATSSARCAASRSSSRPSRRRRWPRRRRAPTR